MQLESCGTVLIKASRKILLHKVSLRIRHVQSYTWYIVENCSSRFHSFYILLGFLFLIIFSFQTEQNRTYAILTKRSYMKDVRNAFDWFVFPKSCFVKMASGGSGSEALYSLTSPECSTCFRFVQLDIITDENRNRQASFSVVIRGNCDRRRRQLGSRSGARQRQSSEVTQQQREPTFTQFGYKSAQSTFCISTRFANTYRLVAPSIFPM